MTQLPKRQLGHSGIEVSVVGLGCNQLGRKLDRVESHALVDVAIEEGITFFDTADVYEKGRSEEFLGAAIKGHREQVVIGTKFGGRKAVFPEGWDGPAGRADFIRHSVEQSLQRLDTDYIDIYWYHAPDGVTPIDDTLVALDALIKEEKIRAIGAANFTADLIEQADRVARELGVARFTAVQNRYNLLARGVEDELLPICERLEIALIPYMPLAKGLLTGKYRREEPAPGDARLAGESQLATASEWGTLKKLAAFASERDITLPHVAIGGLLGQRSVASVIAGATRADQVRENARAVRWIPEHDELSSLQSAIA